MTGDEPVRDYGGPEHAAGHDDDPTAAAGLHRRARAKTPTRTGHPARATQHQQVGTQKGGEGGTTEGEKGEGGKKGTEAGVRERRSGGRGGVRKGVGCADVLIRIFLCLCMA
jgi:hypothetical protein